MNYEQEFTDSVKAKVLKLSYYDTWERYLGNVRASVTNTVYDGRSGGDEDFMRYLEQTCDPPIRSCHAQSWRTSVCYVNAKAATGAHESLFFKEWKLLVEILFNEMTQQPIDGKVYAFHDLMNEKIQLYHEQLGDELKGLAISIFQFASRPAQLAAVLARISKKE